MHPCANFRAIDRLSQAFAEAAQDGGPLWACSVQTQVASVLQIARTIAPRSMLGLWRVLWVVLSDLDPATKTPYLKMAVLPRSTKVSGTLIQVSSFLVTKTSSEVGTGLATPAQLPCACCWAATCLIRRQ